MVRFLGLFLGLFLAVLFLSGPQVVLADGYYICKSGSSCGQYCRYRGADNAENRKNCRKAGCLIGGTRSSRPGDNIKVCSASLVKPSFKFASVNKMSRAGAGV